MPGTRPQNRWHPCLLPDDYQRKLRQDLAEADDAADRTFLDEAESEPEQNDE